MDKIQLEENITEYVFEHRTDMHNIEKRLFLCDKRQTT